MVMVPLVCVFGSIKDGGTGKELLLDLHWDLRALAQVKASSSAPSPLPSFKHVSSCPVSSWISLLPITKQKSHMNLN